MPTQEDFSNAIGMQFKLIPAGEFQIGSFLSPEDSAAICTGPSFEWYRREYHPHAVSITQPFYMGVTHVTQQQYERVTGRNPSCFHGHPEQPIESVTWFDALEFCNLLGVSEALPNYYALANIERDCYRSIDKAAVTTLGGTGYRLPTEAEWEYACRANTVTEWYFDDLANKLEDFAWCGECRDYLGATHSAGQKKPNAWGLYDMHGNVAEWCGDWYDDSYYTESPEDDPTGPAYGSARVTRGGCWFSHAEGCRSADRGSCQPSLCSSNLGFRVVRVPEE